MIPEGKKKKFLRERSYRNTRRKICVVTGSRAEYGLLKPLLDEIQSDKGLKLQLMVTGMHLSREFGFTGNDIKRDGFCIAEEIDISLDSDRPEGISKSVDLGIAGFSQGYKRLRPDIVVVLGDRFEIFSAVVAALISRVPVAHIAGGALTLGAFDDAIRHSITKMSHIHFTSLEEYRKRVIQLGEDPKAVFTVGSLGLDSMEGLKLLTKRLLEKKLRFKFDKKNLLVTFHPVTLENDTSQKQFQNLLDELDNLDDTLLIFTKTNSDTSGRIINRMIDEYTPKNRHRSIKFTSMGSLNYLSTMRFVDGVVGNSSSGIIEAPSFGIGTVNIGDRQTGRIRAKSVIDCEPTREGIKRAIRKMYSKEFQDSIKNVVNPYTAGGAAKKIKNILKHWSIDNVLKKTFHEIDFHLGG